MIYYNYTRSRQTDRPTDWPPPNRRTSRRMSVAGERMRGRCGRAVSSKRRDGRTSARADEHTKKRAGKRASGRDGEWADEQTNRRTVGPMGERLVGRAGGLAGRRGVHWEPFWRTTNLCITKYRFITRWRSSRPPKKSIRGPCRRTSLPGINHIAFKKTKLQKNYSQTFANKLSTDNPGTAGYHSFACAKI